MLEFSVNGKKFSIVSDLHTHTTYSHGTGGIEDNVIAARARGLKKIGIADHGPGHIAFGIKRSAIKKMRAEVDALNEKYDDIEVLLGVEANISDASGRIDVSADEFKIYDYVAAGIHFLAFGGNPVKSGLRSLNNFVNNRSKKSDNIKLMRRNTANVVKALEKNNIKFLTHPGHNAPVDLLEIAIACAKTDTLVELNTSHQSVTADDIGAMALTDAKFIISSDAHSPDHVGDFVASVRLALDAGLDLDRIVNLRIS
ncbi:MAG: PHP domain-containing protein [Clostridiales Family XIII bacterium]|jgi:putative hydrolase|nr:PHP domain-containing protein [Clostridiales Family XIII bacterium]